MESRPQGGSHLGAARAAEDCLRRASCRGDWRSLRGRCGVCRRRSERSASRQTIPSRSYHQVASGLPMISLTLSSSRSGSIGRRNGRINSKLIAEPHSAGSPACNRASEGEEKRPMRPVPRSERFVVFLLFWGGLLGPVQLEDRIDADLPDALLRVGLLAVVLPAAKLAFDLDVRAFRQRAWRTRRACRRRRNDAIRCARRTGRLLSL